MDEPLDVDLDAWDAWDAWSPAEAARRLAALNAPWYVAAGWALDLFLGRQTREHDDLEIGIPARAFPELRHALSGYDFIVVGGGSAWPTTEATLDAHHQTWVREPGGPWRVDVFREPWDDDIWTSRRNPRIQERAASVLLRTADGVPYLRPEIVLLFKAKAVRPKDQADFETVLPRLDSDRRAWLRDALDLAHPGHLWLERLMPKAPS